MSSVRLRRLQADYEKLRQYLVHHPRLMLIQAHGEPPEKYQIEYRIKSLRQKSDQLEEVSSHLVEVTLPLSYPRLPPQCRMLTPVFHPNIAPHAICIGDHWSPGESLESIIRRIGEMLAYQSYNTKSPLNGEAARWVDQNLDRLPLDRVSMDVEEPRATTGQPAAAPVVATATVAQSSPATAKPPPRATTAPASVRPPVPASSSPAAAPPASANPATAALAGAGVIACPSCAARLRVTPQLAGKRVRCPKCQSAMSIPAG